MVEHKSTEFENDYLFTGHELDRETNLYYAHARYLNPRLGVWLSVDPLAEKYPNASPYNYCANNPVKYVDSDGRDFIIWYKVSVYSKKYGYQESYRSFVYNGKNESSAPNVKFVKQVINAHKYNVQNGGGQITNELVTNSKYKVNILEQMPGSPSSGGLNQRGDLQITWDPVYGLEVDNGNILSPATLLEHEADHVKAYSDEGISKVTQRSKSADLRYKDKEERRVIQGAETRTAKANKEIPNSQKYSRKGYTGDLVKVKNETSNKRFND